MPESKENLIIDITGFKCPVPLIKTRRAVKQSPDNQIIKFIGSKEEEISRKEILVALESMKQPIINVEIDNSTGTWQIITKKQST
ncbi:MAG: sulfurtransferase TusA family protein [Candidatus Hodarchaeales archaeon]|jgi:TusA-related sulfurtransferase